MPEYRSIELLQTSDNCADCGRWLDNTDDIESITGLCRICIGEPPVKLDAEDDLCGGSDD